MVTLCAIGFRTGLSCVAALLFVPLSGAGRVDPGAVWRVENAPAIGAVVMLPTRGDAPALNEALAMGEMERALGGVAAVLAKDRMMALRSCAAAAAGKDVVESACSERWRIRLVGAKGSGSLSVLESRGGDVYLRRRGPDAEALPLLRVDRVRFIKLLEEAGGSRYRGTLAAEDAGVEAGVTHKLSAPYAAGDLSMDRETMDDRVFFRSTRFPGTTRTLGQDALWCRLPKGYSARRPAGVVVWINADPSGRIPDVFAPSLDEFNLIGVGAENSGNDRPLADRVQLALDALATVRERFHVDRTRVYVSGISGGGRVSSMLAIAMPLTFHGDIPIVGLNSHEMVEVIARGRGTQVQASFAKPKPPNWTGAHGARIAPITGGMDFNQPEIHARAPGIEKLGFEVRIFEEASMGHQLPPAALLRDAIAWVDEPARTSQADLAASGAAAWAALGAFKDAVGSLTTEQRQNLTAIMKRFPWTSAAWQAADRLSRAEPERPTTEPRTTP